MTGHLSKQGNAAPVRTFVSVELPDDDRRRLGALQDEFRDHAVFLKWSAPQLLHITLHFLGNVPAARLPAVEDATRRSAASARPHRLELAGLGAFPSVRNPRVIWVGLQGGPGLDQLMRLSEALERELEGAGFPREERPFRPHITLARTRDDISGGDRRRVGETLTQVQARGEVGGSFPVESLVVMRSDLQRTGPVYTPLAVAALGIGAPSHQE